MSFALNEIEAMAKRATRGVGYPWGLAEDAGKAARWLCAQGLDGVAVLAAALAHPPGDDAPLMIGVRLSDRAYALPDAELELSAIAQPLMLLPFAAMAARQLRSTLTVACAGAEAVTDGTHLCLSGAFPDPAAALTIRKGGQLSAPRPPSSRATPAQESWDMLNRLAHRTYAPATEESRRLGAGGAALTDND